MEPCEKTASPCRWLVPATPEKEVSTLSTIFTRSLEQSENDSTSQTFYYPKEGATYSLERFNPNDVQARFRTYEPTALFFRITLSKEGGKRGISIKSSFKDDMLTFLAKNALPIKEWGADCQYSEFHSSVPWDGDVFSYYTTNPEVCDRLAKIVLSKNRFVLSENESLALTRWSINHRFDS